MGKRKGYKLRKPEPGERVQWYDFQGEKVEGTVQSVLSAQFTAEDEYGRSHYVFFNADWRRVEG